MARHIVLAFGFALTLVAAPLMITAALSANSNRGVIGGFVLMGAGMLLSTYPVMSQGNTHGLKIWQNDGLPGG